MLQLVKQNLFTVLALVTVPCGYYYGTMLREQKDALKNKDDEIKRIQEQIEQLREEREMMLSKLKK